MSVGLPRLLILFAPPSECGAIGALCGHRSNSGRSERERIRVTHLELYAGAWIRDSRLPKRERIRVAHLELDAGAWIRDSRRSVIRRVVISIPGVSMACHAGKCCNRK